MGEASWLRDKKIKELDKRIVALEDIAHKPKTFVTLDMLFNFQEEMTKRITMLSGMVAKELDLRRPVQQSPTPAKAPWHEKKFSVEDLTKGRWEALERAQQKSQSEVDSYELTTNEKED